MRSLGTLARASAAGVLTLALAGGLGACGGGDSADAPTPTPSSGPASEGSSSEPTGSPSPSDPFAGVRPADGPKVVQGPVAIHVPHGYEVDKSFVHIINCNDIMAGDQLTFSSLSSFAGSSLDGAVRSVLHSTSYGKKPERRRDVTIDGARFFHLSGRQDSEFYVEIYGAMIEDHLVELTFQMHTPAPKRDRIVRSVLASVAIS